MAASSVCGSPQMVSGRDMIRELQFRKRTTSINENAYGNDDCGYMIREPSHARCSTSPNTRPFKTAGSTLYLAHKRARYRAARLSRAARVASTHLCKPGSASVMVVYVCSDMRHAPPSLGGGRPNLQPASLHRRGRHGDPRHERRSTT